VDREPGPVQEVHQTAVQRVGPRGAVARTTGRVVRKDHAVAMFVIAETGDFGEEERMRKTLPH
jgi:hypothetical protein